MPASPQHRFHPSLLREYDIRGIVGETLHEADAHAIGRGFGTVVRRAGGRRVCLGYDGRLSSPALAGALRDGLRGCGLEVLSVGLGPTPMLYFAVHHLEADAGVQVTGSHNPPDYNGFKMILEHGPVYGEAIREIGRMAEAGDYAGGGEDGSARDVAVFDDYVARMMGDYHGTRELSVAWDAGNGAAGPAMVELARRLPGRHECLFAEVDGRFPNHHPDPTVPENLVDLIRAVREGGHEIGIGFDGDGDRIGVVDGQGRIVFGDQILQVLASDVLARHPGATIIADVKTSQTFFDEVARQGGRPLMWKTGHSLIKAKMAETGSPLSGEMSGHIFYKDGFYGHDDALYVAVRLLDILARGDATMAELRDRMPEVHNTPEVRFACPEEDKFRVIGDLKARLLAAGAEVDTTDGVRVRRPGGWWLLRASNTQPVLVARAEATSEAGLERLKDEVRRALGDVGLTAPADF